MINEYLENKLDLLDGIDMTTEAFKALDNVSVGDNKIYYIDKQDKLGIEISVSIDLNNYIDTNNLTDYELWNTGKADLAFDDLLEEALESYSFWLN